MKILVPTLAQFLIYLILSCLHQKWSDYKLLNVTVELHDAAVYMKPDQQKKFHENEETEDKIFVAFKIDNIPERRPYLLSRDLAYARPSGCEVEPFQVVIFNFSFHVLCWLPYQYFGFFCFNCS